MILGDNGMFDFFILLAAVGVGVGAGYFIAQTEGESFIDRVRNFFGLGHLPKDR